MTLTQSERIAEIRKDAEWLVAPANLANSKYSERARNVARAYLLSLPPVGLTKDEAALVNGVDAAIEATAPGSSFGRSIVKQLVTVIQRLTSASVGAPEALQEDTAHHAHDRASTSGNTVDSGIGVGTVGSLPPVVAVGAPTPVTPPDDRPDIPYFKTGRFIDPDPSPMD